MSLYEYDQELEDLIDNIPFFKLEKADKEEEKPPNPICNEDLFKPEDYHDIEINYEELGRTNKKYRFKDEEESVDLEEPIFYYEKSKIEEEIGNFDEESLQIYLEAIKPKFHSPKEPILNNALQLLRNYTHEQACRFRAIQNIWINRPPPINNTVILETEVTGHYAVYRICEEGYGRYRARSCHVDEPEMILIYTRGLLSGDLIVVKEMFKDEDKWIAKRMVLLERDVEKDQQIMMMSNGRGIVMGKGELMKVSGEMEEDQVYLGDVFRPVHNKQNIQTEEGGNKKITPPPMSIIFNIRPNPSSTAHLYYFLYCPPSSPTTDYIEFCGSMGSTALRAYRNTRSDDRVLPLKYLQRKRNNYFLLFGNCDPILWNDQNLSIGVDCVMSIRWNDGTRILAKLWKGFPRRCIDYVFQRPVSPATCLKPGFYQDLEDGSNGKVVINALFGGTVPPTISGGLEELKGWSPDKAQSKYLANLLGSNPITIGHFGNSSGKSTTIIQAAFCMTRRSTQHLIVAETNARISKIVNKILKLKDHAEARPMRYLCDSRRDFKNMKQYSKIDLPVLLVDFLVDIVKGRLELEEDIVVEGSTFKRQSIILNASKFLLHYDLIKLAEMTPEARYIVGDDDYPIIPSFSYYFQLFLHFYQPKVIIINAAAIWSTKYYKNVRSVQFDEAENIPLTTIVAACSYHPIASIGLMKNPRNGMKKCQLSESLTELAHGTEHNFNRFEVILSEKSYLKQ